MQVDVIYDHMDVRDAVEEDAESIAALADVPADVIRNLVHDRSVRVAERQQAGNDPNADTDALESELLGFVSFDVHDHTVHVTQVGGTKEACERLLSEPVRFAAAEGLDVELLVEQSATDLQTAAQAAGFQEDGDGPVFRGSPTIRYHQEP